MAKPTTPTDMMRKAMGLKNRFDLRPLNVIRPQTLQQMAYLLGKAALDKATTARKK